MSHQRQYERISIQLLIIPGELSAHTADPTTIYVIRMSHQERVQPRHQWILKVPQVMLIMRPVLRIYDLKQLKPRTGMRLPGGNSQNEKRRGHNRTIIFKRQTGCQERKFSNSRQGNKMLGQEKYSGSYREKNFLALICV